MVYKQPEQCIGRLLYWPTTCDFLECACSTEVGEARVETSLSSWESWKYSDDTPTAFPDLDPNCMGYIEGSCKNDYGWLLFRACFFTEIHEIPVWRISKFSNIEEFLNATLYLSIQKLHQIFQRVIWDLVGGRNFKMLVKKNGDCKCQRTRCHTMSKNPQHGKFLAKIPVKKHIWCDFMWIIHFYLVDAQTSKKLYGYMQNRISTDLNIAKLNNRPRPKAMCVVGGVWLLQISIDIKLKLLWDL